MFKSLQEMLESRELASFLEDKLGNFLCYSDPDRADRILEAAELGCNGSTHREVIEDWQDFLKNYERDNAPDEFDEPEKYQEFEAIIETIENEIEECYKWHEENGSLDTEIG